MNLVLDLGQSGARVRINGVDSQFNKPKNSAEPIVQTLRRIFEEIPAQKFETVYLSLTGLQGTVPDVAPYGNLCHEFFSAARVAVMDDGIAAYDGAIGSRDGVVLTLGSGIVAIAGNHGADREAEGLGRDLPFDGAALPRWGACASEPSGRAGQAALGRWHPSRHSCLHRWARHAAPRFA